MPHRTHFKSHLLHAGHKLHDTETWLCHNAWPKMRKSLGHACEQYIYYLSLCFGGPAKRDK